MEMQIQSSSAPILKKEVHILIVEDDSGHASLIQRNIQRAGIGNPTTRFCDGQEALDFLFAAREGLDPNAFLLLLDIRMPKVDGVETLRRIKEDEELKRIPVIMLTTTDDPEEVRRCHSLGCSNYIIKPVEYVKFAEVIQRMGHFFSIIQAPEIRLASDA